MTWIQWSCIFLISNIFIWCLLFLRHNLPQSLRKLEAFKCGGAYLWLTKLRSFEFLQLQKLLFWFSGFDKLQKTHYKIYFTCPLTHQHSTCPKAPVKSVGICSTCDVITINQERPHLCASWRGGQDLSNGHLNQHHWVDATWIMY